MFRKSLSQLLIITLVLAAHLLGLGLMFSQAETNPPTAKAAAVMVAALLPPASQPRPSAQITPEPKAVPKAAPAPAPKKMPAKKPAKAVTRTAVKTPARLSAKPLKTAAPSERAITTALHQTAAPNTAQKPASDAIAPPSADAKAAQNRAPAYPSLSRKKKEQGTVLLKLLVKADGSVGSISVLKSSGYQRLDQAALQAVKHWRFTPATQQGKNIDYWYEMPMTFALNN